MKLNSQNWMINWQLNALGKPSTEGLFCSSNYQSGIEYDVTKEYKQFNYARIQNHKIP